MCFTHRYERKWLACTQKQLHLYADARSTPPRAAAVLLRQASSSVHSRSDSLLLSFEQGTVKSSGVMRQYLTT